MEFLKMLENIRVPFLNTLMSIITYVGDEIFFILIAIILFWCYDKRQGYYLFTVGFAGTVLNQFLKLWYRIPRPWVKDPNFTIVENARRGASGYSFPSGHTQSTVGSFGVIFMSNKKKWIRILSIALIIIVPFSRMYLGVHTPLDVGVSFIIAAILVFALYPCFKSEENFRKTMPWLLGVLLIICAAYMSFVLLYDFPADIDINNYNSGVKNAFTLSGAVLGLAVSYFIDRKFINFETKAPLSGQILKLVLGLIIMLVIRSVLKAPLNMLFRGSHVADLVRYFIMVIFAGCIWPLTFPFFAKIGKNKTEQ